jgi:hypothetical protein
VIVAGLPGADTSGALANAGVERSHYLTISLHSIMEELAARQLIPLVPGLSPMDASELVHAESAWLAKRLGLRAIADGKNILWDITMASMPSIQSWLDALEAAGYSIQGIFVDISVEESVSRVDAEHRRRHEDYRNGDGYGGRYIRPEAIRALADGLRGQAAQPGAPHPDRPPATASDDVTGPILGYVAGNLTLEDVVRWFRARRWPDVPSACPPGLERAASAIDDPEPYVPGSFDDVVRAYDLGQLTDVDYEFLGRAALAARRAERDGE